MSFICCLSGMPPVGNAVETDYRATQSLWLAEKRERGVPIWNDCFTVDDAKSRDMDDAIGIRQLDSHLYEVKTVIALVPATVPLYSKAYHEAEYKIASRYEDRFVEYMLPSDVTEELCSLNPFQYKPGMGYTFLIDTQNGTLDYTLEEIIFQSNNRLTPQHLQSSPEAEKFLPVTNFLRENRLYNQYVNRRTEEGADRIEPPSYTPLTRNAKQGISHAIVEELMVVTNTVTADYAYHKDIPHIYRIATMPVEKGGKWIKSYTGDVSVFDDKEYLLYSHNTSPIRRYTDLCNQYNLVAYLNTENSNKEKMPFTTKNMKQIAQRANDYAGGFYFNGADIVQSPYVAAESGRFRKRQDVNTIGDFFKQQNSYGLRG